MTPDEPRTPSRVRTGVGYALMIGATVGAYFLIRSLGLGLTAPPPPAGSAPFGVGAGAAHVDHLPHVLLALAAILVAARGLGWLFARLHQPPVVGEIIAGILLGPSLLGRVAPAAAHFILP